MRRLSISIFILEDMRRNIYKDFDVGLVEDLIYEILQLRNEIFINRFIFKRLAMHVILELNYRMGQKSGLLFSEGQYHHVLYMGMASRFYNEGKSIPAIRWTHNWWLCH